MPKDEVRTLRGAWGPREEGSRFAWRGGGLFPWRLRHHKSQDADQFRLKARSGERGVLQEETGPIFSVEREVRAFELSGGLGMRRGEDLRGRGRTEGQVPGAASQKPTVLEPGSGWRGD